MRTVDLAPVAGRQWLADATMHPTVAELILTRIDKELDKIDLCEEEKSRLMYHIEYHGVPRAVECVSVYLPSVTGDPRDTALLVIIQFALTLSANIKAIENVRIPKFYHKQSGG